MSSLLPVDLSVIRHYTNFTSHVTMIQIT